MVLAIGLFGSSASAEEPSSPRASDRVDWETLLADGVTVRCGSWKDDPWCEATAVLPGSTDAVLALLNDVEDLPRLFPRMVVMKEVAPDILHQVLDYPFPYDDRDLVARFTWTHSEAVHVLSWRSVTEPAVPTVGVRLTGAQGRFELRPHPSGHTSLTYVWRGELGPGVPDWVRPFAWKNQAREVVDGMSAGLRAARSAP
jgi:hypothetical protein